jgi:SAM-dependent methyltransferase
MNVIIWGYCSDGAILYRKLKKNDAYKILGFADNAICKQGKYVDGVKIKTLDDVIELNREMELSVIIVSRKWYVIGQQLEENGINIEGVYLEGKIVPYNVAGFDKLNFSRGVSLYAGDICDEEHMKIENLYGLSINKADAKHILHDITVPYPLPDNCIDSYQAEDVLEHISLDKIISTINEIYRVLKQGALFRICLPDYYSPWLRSVSMLDDNGDILYDPTGGGTYGENGVENGGHVWFPNYDNVKELLKQTKFNKNEFMCYRTVDGELHMKDIDFSKGYVKRVYQKKNDEIYSIVIDCYK